MSGWKHYVHAALGAISILMIGVVIGIALGRTVLQGRSVAIDEHRQAVALDAGSGDFIHGLRNDLGFTEQQATQVHEILRRHQLAVNEAWTIVHSRLEAAMDSVTSEIEAILDSEQRARLHEWLVDRHGLLPSNGLGEVH